MAVKVQVTSVIQKVVDGQREFDAEGATVAELIENIDNQYPGFRGQIADESGELHRFVNIYLNDEDIRFLDGKDTAVSAGDTISFLPALAGGAVPPPPPARRAHAPQRPAVPPRHAVAPGRARRAPERPDPANQQPRSRKRNDCGC